MMKIILTRWLALACWVSLVAGLGVAQKSTLAPANNRQETEQNHVARLQLSELDQLEPKAKQVVDVSIDGRMIRFLASLLNPKKPEEAQIREALLDLKGIYVRNYDFEAVNTYTPSDVEAIRRQIKKPQWTRLVGVRSALKGENIEVYTMLEGDKMNGLAIISTDPRQLTVVNVVGMIDFEKLRLLEGRWGIPKLDINLTGDDDKKEEKEKAKPDNKDPKKP